MANFQDWTVAFAKESTYGTAVVTDKYLEWGDFKPLAPDLGTVQSESYRAGVRAPILTRRPSTVHQASGPVAVDLATKGQGFLHEASMGSGTPTLVSGTTYQHLYQFADTLPSYTGQFCQAATDGTVSPVTFKGCMVDSFDLSIDQNGIAKLTVNWDAQDWSTAIAAASQNWVAGANVLTFKHLSVKAGTLTLATTIALASATTPLAGVKSVKVSVNNSLIKDRIFAGSGGLKAKPVPGDRVITGELQVEYLTNTLRDAFLNQTEMPLLIDLTGEGALSAGFETFQLALSSIKLDGDLPEGSRNGAPVQPIKFTAGSNLTAAQIMQIVTRTSDATI